MNTMTGGCQCGRVRYSAEIESDDAYLCHCRMCQRATGGVSIAFVNVPVAAVRWDSAPDWYQSSPIAHRPFCATCGTPLGFAFLKDGENVDLTVGSFDDPSRFKPVHHYATESMHEAWIDTRDLPRIRSEQNENVRQRWMDACGKTPD
ncbi:GFA family protein [Sphingomonas dokdonensis]|uniref:Glutathione-dependent formaldehyde-activating enzyme n=1 Tax=Sphingomonas dokdonensis TaxID=344880 RepID=A0A245ZHY8_9SPHN|nr:GFA family protein [Sphingomonas dokdonensis]OWK29348.1 glutathione-dependent formaldehyde-activating enzyme [Sphingomonas dokdonensis]